MEVAYLLNNKYRVHEVAKDFKKNSKEITDKNPVDLTQPWERTN